MAMTSSPLQEADSDIRDSSRKIASSLNGRSRHAARFNRKKAVLLSAAAIGCAAALVFGFRRWKSKNNTESSDLASVVQGDIEVHFSDSGELRPKSYVDIASKVSGRIIRLPAEEGRQVKKGGSLAVVQPGRSEIERYVPFAVTSPLAGVVMRYQQEGNYQQEGRIARLGDYVTGLLDSNSPTYLMTVADLSKLIVKMKISEMDVLKLKEGMNVKVTVDALPNETFPGQVSLISPQADKDENKLKTFKVEVSIAKNDTRLKPGMTARVDGLLESKKGVVKIPLSAVFDESGKEIAYVSVAKGSPKRTELKLGLRNEIEAEVLGGVSQGQKVLTEKPAEGKKP